MAPVATSYDLFVSHSSKDSDFARRLARDLTDAGLKVWVDEWNIGMGESIARAIEHGLSQSRFVLLVMSPDYFQSSWTRQEWQASMSAELLTEEVKAIPILYRDCEIPGSLRAKQWVDFREASNYESSKEKLLIGIRGLLTQQHKSVVAVAQPKPGERVEALDAATLRELGAELRAAVALFKSTPPTPEQTVSLAEPGDERLCFVVMPFSVESLNIVYEDFVRPTLVDKCGLHVERGDDVFGSNVVMDDITRSIRRSRLILADLTSRNPNVFYEVGIAHALNKQVLLMTQSIDDVPFDLRHRRALVYEYSPRGCKRLETDLYANIQHMLANRQ